MPHTHYKVLGLTPPADRHARVSLEEVKAAYRRALLRHHPDKSGKILSKPPAFTIDEITSAYKVLSNDAERAEYDLQLRLADARQESDTAHPGLETVDLDDMSYDEDQVLWFRGCRCGQARGFRITESDLEKEVHRGEIITGCVGCSLWLKVLFRVAEDG